MLVWSLMLLTVRSFLKGITCISTWKYRASISLCADMNKHTHTSFHTRVHMTNDYFCVVYLRIIGDAICRSALTAIIQYFM